MTPHQIDLVQKSFALVLPIKEQAAELFYGRLFSIDPSAAPLFATSDMKMQGSKLMATLAMIVAGLNKPETIIPKAEDLARRHVGYGVVDAQYGTVGAALIWTLERGLGPNFDAETRAAWEAAYALLSGIMIRAADAA